MLFLVTPMTKCARMWNVHDVFWNKPSSTKIPYGSNMTAYVTDFNTDKRKTPPFLPFIVATYSTMQTGDNIKAFTLIPDLKKLLRITFWNSFIEQKLLIFWQLGNTVRVGFQLNYMSKLEKNRNHLQRKTVTNEPI